MRPLRSPVHAIPVDALRAAVQTAASAAEVLRRFGLPGEGRSVAVLRERLSLLNIPQDHLRVGRAHGRAQYPWNRFTAVQVRAQLVDGADLVGAKINRQLRTTGLLPEVCAICGLGPEWQGRPLRLHLDHINGVRRDWRLENLRFLCPNCHTQTPTYAGKNIPAVRARRLASLKHCPVVQG